MRLLALVLLLPAGAFGQGAGGYTAGPGELAPEPQYATRVVGYYPSPSFTQDREFTNTRLWVLDPGKVTVEQWWTGSFGAPAAAPSLYPGDQFFQTEVELGVAPRVQLDIYANTELNQDASGSYRIAPGGHTGLAAEVRVALARYWGEIWGNPTLYFELSSQHYNSPRAEVRLLMGGTLLTPKLLGAVNLAFERNIFRDAASGIDYEIKGDFGFNYEVIPRILRLGVEGVLGYDSHGTLDAQGRSPLHPVLAVGPSVLLTEPRKRVKLLAALLHGFADWDQPWIPTVILSTTF
jgi:hypothetical protein